MKWIVVATVLLSLFPVNLAWSQTASDEHEFQQLAAALKANDVERQAAITTCIKQGIGDNPAAAAKFMGVPVDRAAEAWCTRMTNGIANSKLTLADVTALNKGAVTPGAREILTTTSEGK